MWLKVKKEAVTLGNAGGRPAAQGALRRRPYIFPWPFSLEIMHEIKKPFWTENFQTKDFEDYGTDAGCPTKKRTAARARAPFLLFQTRI
jgi:hypothetical protein